MPKLRTAGQIRPTFQLLLAGKRFKKCSCISYVPVYIVNFLRTSEKCLIIVSSEHIITNTIEGNAIDITYVDELEFPTVLTYHCATASVWPSMLVIAQYFVLTVKTLDIPSLECQRTALFK